MSVKGYDSFLVTTSLGANRKVRRLTPAERWCAVHGVWAIAAESPERGTLWIAEGVPATERDYAELAGVSLAVAKSTVRKMRELGMLESGDGAEHVHDWDEHQPSPRPSESPESRRDRKRKSRERHADVTRDTSRSHTPQVEGEGKGKTTPPNPPTGGRKRDRDRYEQEVEEYAVAMCPDVPRLQAVGLVQHAIGQIRAQRRQPTNDEVLAFVRRWTPGEATA